MCSWKGVWPIHKRRTVQARIAYYMQKGGEGVQIACKNAYVINGMPHMQIYLLNL